MKKLLSISTILLAMACLTPQAEAGDFDVVNSYDRLGSTSRPINTIKTLTNKGGKGKISTKAPTKPKAGKVNGVKTTLPGKIDSTKSFGSPMERSGTKMIDLGARGSTGSFLGAFERSGGLITDGSPLPHGEVIVGDPLDTVGGGGCGIDEKILHLC